MTAALVCAGCCLLWMTPAQAQYEERTALPLRNGDTYVVQTGKTITVSYDNRNGKPTSDDNSTIVYGVQLDSGSAAVQGGVVAITAQSWGGTAKQDAYAEAYGLYAAANESINVDGKTDIMAQAVGGTASDDASAFVFGIKADGAGSTITVSDKANIQVQSWGGVSDYASAQANGLQAYGDNSTVTIGGSAAIRALATGGAANTASGDASAYVNGIQAYGDNSAVTISGDTAIIVQAAGGRGKDAIEFQKAKAYAYGVANDGKGKIELKSNVEVAAQAAGGEAQAVNGEAYAEAYGLQTSVTDSSIAIGGDANVAVLATGGKADAAGGNASANAYGIYTSGSNSTISIDGAANVTVQADGGMAATSLNMTAEAYGLYAGKSASSITIGGDAVIKAQARGGTVSGVQAKAKARSLYASGDNSSITVNAAEEHTVQLTGDVEAVNKGRVTVQLTNADSFLQGNVLTDSSGTVDLTVANSAVWQPLYDNRNGSFFDRSEYDNVTGNDYKTTVNNIDKITLQNGGVIDLSWDMPLRGGSWRTMKINDLTTNDGVIRINSDITNNVGDVFEIANVNAGASLGVQVGYDKASQKGWGTYEGRYTVLTGAAAENIATYGLFYENRAGAYTPIMDGADMVALKIEPSSNIKAAGNAAYSALQLGTVVSNHLDKRLGELRDGSEDGVWARVYGGDLKNSAHGQMKTRYKAIQGGYDQAYDENGGTGRIGGAFSYASGDLELPRGGGDNKAWDFALYKTWQGAKGHYYDLGLHYGKVDTDYHTTDLSRHYSIASFDAHTLGLTAEYGYRKDLQAGWYCQPQAEVSWFRLGSADYTASSGMQVAQDSAISLQGRLGIGVGRKLANGTHYYATLSGVHEFDGKVSLRGDGMGYEQDYGGTWGEFVLGVTAPIDKSWDGYASAERLFGGDVGSTWQLNAGVRLRF